MRLAALPPGVEDCTLGRLVLGLGSVRQQQQQQERDSAACQVLRCVWSLGRLDTWRVQQV
jgi:hypothetical protein